MKVLVLHSELGVLRGGGETFTRNLFNAFAKRGHRIAAAFIADRHGRYPVTLPSSIEPIPLPGWWSRKLGQPTLSTVRRYIPSGTWPRAEWDRIQEAICWRTIRWHNRRFQRRVERELARRWDTFDAVYVQSNVELAGKVALYRPTVLMLPGPVGAEYAQVLRRVHAVCAHDDGLLQLRSFLGDFPIELPLGLDTQLFSPGPSSIRSRLGWTDQHQVVGYVGRLTQLKGVDLLADAFRRISRIAADTRLLIVGSGEEEEYIRSILRNEFARGIVHIEPTMNQEQLPSWYRAMDLIVMPSRYETMSNSVLEAMASGIPFLASKVGGNIILGKTGAGWLFESESVSSLITSMGDILQSTPELKARGKIGVDYVQEHHSWAATAERLERIIASCLGVRK